MNRKPQPSTSQQQRAREQQAVLNQLRAGQGITGARPANPIIGGIQNLFGGAGAGTIPTLNAAKLGGQEVLMNRGGWDSRVAGSGPINVGGQTWYPAQSGQDLVYKRAPGNVGGQYGSIFSTDQAAAPAAPVLPAAERAYEAEKSRVAQLTAQDPELQRYKNARLKAVAAGATPEQVQSAEDIGMQIWQQKYGNTPMGQPGGAVGTFNPLMQRTFGYQTGSAPDQQMGAPTLGPSPLVPQVDQALNPASPNYIGGEGAPLMDFTRDEVTPELIEAYQKQLLQQAAAGRK